MIQDDSFWSTERLLPSKKRRASPSGGIALATLRETAVSQERIFANREYPHLRSLYGATVGEGGPSSVVADGFLASAKAHLHQTGDSKRPYCPYFSYAPSFSELSEKQLNSYLCFREDVEARRYRGVDYSYLVLYLYERLNLLDEKNAAQTLQSFLWIWEHYRCDFAVLDKLLSDWVTDLCVEWDLPFPLARLDGILPKIRAVTSPVLHTLYLFDYLLAGEVRPHGEQVNYILRCLCDYGYRTVSLYRENSLYAASMDGYLADLFAEGFLTATSQREDFLSMKIPTRLALKRASYPGAILDPSRRRTLCYEYCPLLGDVNVKHRFTSLVKYADNRVRKRMGMKMKFSMVAVSPVHRQFMDLRFEVFFAARLPEVREEAAASMPQAAPKRQLQVDLQKAAAIEASSWKTTDELTRDLYSEEGEMILLGEKKEEPPEKAQEFTFSDSTEEDVTEFCASLDPMETEFTVYLLYTDLERTKAFSRAKGQFYDNLLRRVNQKAMELLGDVVIEPSGEIIEDYREQLEFLLPKDQYLPYEA